MVTHPDINPVQQGLFAFEREHFDVYNVTPDRVTTAFFTLPDPNGTMQHIFDALPMVFQLVL